MLTVEFTSLQNLRHGGIRHLKLSINIELTTGF